PVPGPPDHAHPALADLALDLVGADHPREVVGRGVGALRRRGEVRRPLGEGVRNAGEGGRPGRARALGQARGPRGAPPARPPATGSAGPRSCFPLARPHPPRGGFFPSAARGGEGYCPCRPRGGRGGLRGGGGAPPPPPPPHRGGAPSPPLALPLPERYSSSSP